jgi:protein-tyrosine-phosphatase
MDSQKVAFVCLHGSAKSLIAAEYFNRIATERNLPLRATTAGPEPDGEVPQNVVAGLRSRGIDVSQYRPTLIAAERQNPLLMLFIAVAELPVVIPLPTRAVEIMLDTTPTAMTRSGKIIPLYPIEAYPRMTEATMVTA